MVKSPDYKEVLESSTFLLNQLGFIPDLAIQLGSGQKLEEEGFGKLLFEIPYEDIPHFKQATVPGHEGQLKIIKKEKQVIAFFSGRSHLYEGHTPFEIVFPIRVLYEWGCKNLLLFNCAGSLREDFGISDLVLIKDHLNFMGKNPLVGSNFEFWGQRFPSLDSIYKSPLRQFVSKKMKENQGELKEGIYVGILGPSYETPAEIKMFQTLGADLIGMSTVMEMIAAAHLDMNVAAISLVTNLCFNRDQALDHQEVLEQSALSSGKLEHFISNLVEDIESLSTCMRYT